MIGGARDGFGTFMTKIAANLYESPNYRMQSRRQLPLSDLGIVISTLDLTGITVPVNFLALVEVEVEVESKPVAST